jgi:hypothetical protein
MDKHSVSSKTGLEIVAKILGRTKFATLGRVGMLGQLVVASYDKNDTSVTMQVSLQPELVIEVFGNAGSDPAGAGFLFEEADNASEVLRNTFEVLQVA